jgi:predicted MFS family arabinose efflux permease
VDVAKDLGIIADQISWRWAFLIQTPLCLVAFVAVLFLLNIPVAKPAASTLPESESWKTKLARVDFVGAMTLLCAVGALIYALDLGSNSTTVSWTSPLTIGISFLAIGLFGAFLLVEKYVAAEPFAPGHLIFSMKFIGAYLCNFFSFAGWLAAIFYIPLFFQAVHGLSATQASLRLIPSIICGVSGSLFAGKYMQRTGKYYKLTIGCYTSLVVGMLIITISSTKLVSDNLQIPGMMLGMMTCAFSNGIGVTSSLIGLLANATSKDQAVATACSYLFRSLGSVFGIAISATAMNQTLKTTLKERLRELGMAKDADKIANMVRRSLAALKELSPEVRTAVRECYAQGTRVAFSVEVVLVTGAAISAWFIREKALSR